MGSFKNITYPIAIYFRTNIDVDWSEDMSSYITRFNINDRIEDEPFTFVDNEIILDFWDYDGNFIKSTWNESIKELEMKVESEGEIIFYGYVELPKIDNKKSVLNIDERTKKSKLYFGTGFKRFDATITSRPLRIYEDIDTQRARTTPVSRIDDLLDFFLPDIVLDYSELPIFNDAGYCYHRIYTSYFYDQENNIPRERTIFELLKDIAIMYDCYFSYDGVTNTLTYHKRENIPSNLSGLTEDISQNKFKLTPSSKLPEYTGVSVSNTLPIIEKDRIDGSWRTKPKPSYIKFDTDGTWQYSNIKSVSGGSTPDRVIEIGPVGTVVERKVTNVYVPDTNSETYLVGEKQNIFEVSLDILGYLYTQLSDNSSYLYSPPDTISNSLFPSSTLRQIVRKNLLNGVLRYLKPSIEYILETKEDISTVGSRYSIDFGSLAFGTIVEMNYYRKFNETNISHKWRQMIPYEVENFYLGATDA